MNKYYVPLIAFEWAEGVPGEGVGYLPLFRSLKELEKAYPDCEYAEVILDESEMPWLQYEN